MTPFQERRLILAAIDFAANDRLVQAVRRSVRSGEKPVWILAEALKERAKAKKRLLRAAGVFRKQRLLPIEKMRNQA
jgi:hypothetical protein